ncbi:Oidioi.mRNA.OKI2018_I69.XSR.g14024.t1.cds [Oikopleura dioica]|uniref:Nitric oxide synthase-interacting protein n=1 Tax=Oikopleura dioica TaxID=34765 RepID=A0ABN7SCI0_OIKDI|nr:Oidioi.mRNA.OKI2018_I69.XSR.g14024.t1.cds [Oikopleura dioica]
MFSDDKAQQEQYSRCILQLCGAAEGFEGLRLSKDSVGEFDVCNLSLQICKDPVVTPEGVIYDREAILTYMLDQKTKIAQTKKRKLKEAAAEEAEEELPKKVFKGESTRDVATDRFGSGTASFWDASKAPTTKKESAFKEKDVDKVRDPVTGSILKLKKLVKIKFTPVDPTMSETKRQASKSRWKCPVTGDILSNKIACVVIKPTGDVVTSKAADVMKKDMIFPIGDVALKSTDFIPLRRGGTGFASANEGLAAKMYRPVMQA